MQIKNGQDDIDMVRVVKAEFEENARLLARVRPSGRLPHGISLKQSKDEYKASIERLQPLGEWSLDRIREMFAKIQAKVPLPKGYAYRDDSIEREFVAGEILRGDNNVSLYAGNPGLDLATEEQFRFEVRAFLDEPRCFVPFREGNQYAFKGRDIGIFNGEKFTKVETYGELAQGIIAALNRQISTLPYATRDGTVLFVEPSGPETPVQDKINEAAKIAFETAKERWDGIVVKGGRCECLIESTDIFEGLNQAGLPGTDEMETAVEGALNNLGFYTQAANAFDSTEQNNRPKMGG